MDRLSLPLGLASLVPPSTPSISQAPFNCRPVRRIPARLERQDTKTQNAAPLLWSPSSPRLYARSPDCERSRGVALRAVWCRCILRRWPQEAGWTTRTWSTARRLLHRYPRNPPNPLPSRAQSRRGVACVVCATSSSSATSPSSSAVPDRSSSMLAVF